MKIGLIGLGDMGAAVGRSLVAAGHEVSAVFAGRSDESVKRAQAASIEEAKELVDLSPANVVLSIVPPGVAVKVATEFATALGSSAVKPLYADLNAIAPATSQAIAGLVHAAGLSFVDGGIIGAAPFKRSTKTRIYLSGEHAAQLSYLSTDEIDASICGTEVGQASGLKMVYAGLTKGAMTLHTTVLLAAHRLGLIDPFFKELEASQPAKLKAMRGSVPFIAADSVRWADEMDEIAACFAALGVTDKFHQGAGETFRLLAKTPLEAETRETTNLSRTLEQALAIYAAALEE